MSDHPLPTRVVHRLYGRGDFIRILPTLGKSQARVRFDGTSAPRRVWLDDLTPEPAGMPASPAEPRNGTVHTFPGAAA